jgi:nitric oxide synthase oxygenase domain/subunit
MHCDDHLELFNCTLVNYRKAAARWAVVSEALSRTGTFHLTTEELHYGAQTAWRNAPRCPGRIQWRNLTLLDRRNATTLQEVFESLVTHIRVSTNGGNIKPAITVFPPREEGKPDKFRVWNKQLLQYAGYKMEDGSVVGDPVSVEFTAFCQRLGWKGKQGRFDVLPLVLSDASGCPKFFEIPKKEVKVVKIRHPR